MPISQEVDKQPHSDNLSSKDFLSLKFSTLQDLDNWISKYKDKPSIIDCFRVPREDLSRFTRSKSKPQRLLVCHDFKGNYCIGEDESPLGYFPHNTGEHYFLQYPSLVDCFIYFSHNRISVPPVSWTEMLHRQGILSLGCIILEGNNNEEMDKLVSRDEKDGKFIYVKHLALIAKRYSFDGWLINPESHFKDQSLADDLVLFTEDLKATLHTQNKYSKVIYYDSFVSSKNRVIYQNGVTEMNYRHFDSADYFFTNYWWDETHLKTTRENIGVEGVKRKVFIGIDVWGRGSKIGSGGFETGLALNKVTQFGGGNIALFAPGWTYEYFNKIDEFISNDQKFWIGDVSDDCPGGGISTYVEHGTTPIFSSSSGGFKFYTNFSQGEGLSYCIKGKVVFDEKWVNIGLQSYTPPGLKEGILEVEKYDPFNGGVSLKVIYSPDTAFGDDCPISLFKFNKEVLTSTVNLGISYKYITKNLKGSNYFQIEVTYYIERRYRTTIKLKEGVLILKLKPEATADPQNISEWITLETELMIPNLNPREHLIISGIQLRYVDLKNLKFNKFLDKSWIMIPKLNSKKMVILLGELSIFTLNCNTHPIISVKKKELSTNQILVSWKDDYENVLNWFVYCNGKLLTVSNVSHCVLNKMDRLRVDIFTRNGKIVKGHDLFV